MSISDRIKKLIELEGSQINFANKTGLNKNAVSYVLKNDAGLRSDSIQMILRAYPALNARWLITGEGKQWEEGSKEAQEIADLIPKDDRTTQLMLIELLLRELERVAKNIRSKDPEEAEEIRKLVAIMRQENKL